MSKRLTTYERLVFIQDKESGITLANARDVLRFKKQADCRAFLKRLVTQGVLTFDGRIYRIADSVRM